MDDFDEACLIATDRLLASPHTRVKLQSYDKLFHELLSCQDD